ncbi:uncharacterized protein LOC117230036 [Megalopta genalis]|uniref:uncharacterized protein LOC117230036 n=1 Tax=Megalopta genalis TaxID=115081 RepID=UPI003FD3ACF5
MWMLYVALVAAFTGSLIASPQRSSEVDGFVFDGPISGDTTTENVVTTSTTSTPSTTTDAPVSTTMDSACISRCPTTFEYNPVCGTDNVLYPNPGRLNCASLCGKGVSIQHFGPCRTASSRG